MAFMVIVRGDCSENLLLMAEKKVEKTTKNKMKGM
jgi:hypothetical protein